MAKRLDDNGLLYLLSKLLLLFVRSEPGKGLSTNDLTDELKQMILNQFDGRWASLTGKPTNVSEWANDANYQSALQVSSAISTALAASGQYLTGAWRFQRLFFPIYNGLSVLKNNLSV